MIGGLSQTTKYSAAQASNRKYDGIFYVAASSTGLYCRPSCSNPTPPQNNCLFFETVEEAQKQGYHACKHCHPDRLKNRLSLNVLSGIESGAINEQGVHGLADSLHISERHLRRIVHDRTGTSPLNLNQAKRLKAAQQLVVQTKLPIIDIAFYADFSSLRQFNDVFKKTFKTSPSEMRKTATKNLTNSVTAPLKVPPYDQLTNKQGNV